MCPDNGAKQFPRPPTTIHPDHAQYLEKAESSKGRGGEDLPTAAEAQDDYTGWDDYDVCKVRSRSSLVYSQNEVKVI